MKAAVLNKYATPLDVEELKVDEPRAGEVLIRTGAASICHSDVTVADVFTVLPLPVVMGHESAGVVEAVGPGVDYVKPGDHVVTCLSGFCGHCEYCLTGRPSLCQQRPKRAPDAPPRLSRDGERVNQMEDLGSFAEQLLVHEHALVKIDDDMPLDRACLLGCGAITGLGAVFNTAKVPPGSTVAVVGCGGVGLSIVQGARIGGAIQIVAIDRLPEKLDAALELGATDAINAADVDVVEAVQELIPGGVEYVFEAIGSKATVESAVKLVRIGGTLTIVGVIRHLSFEIAGQDIALERKVQTTMMGSNRFRIDIPKYVQLYKQGRLRLDELVTDRIGLDGVNEGFDALRSGKGLRRVIVFD